MSDAVWWHWGSALEDARSQRDLGFRVLGFRVWWHWGSKPEDLVSEQGFARGLGALGSGAECFAHGVQCVGLGE